MTYDDQVECKSQIEATDQQIDRLVYDLYGLTEDEIKIVEAVFWAVLAVMAGGRE